MQLKPFCSIVLFIVFQLMILKVSRTMQWPSPKGHFGDDYNYLDADSENVDKSLFIPHSIVKVDEVSLPEIPDGCEPIPGESVNRDLTTTTCSPTIQTTSDATVVVNDSVSSNELHTTQYVEATTQYVEATTQYVEATTQYVEATTQLSEQTPVTECFEVTTSAPEAHSDSFTTSNPCGDNSYGNSGHVNEDSEQRSNELRILIQHLYVAQARVQLEATEIRKAQAVATSTQQQLEEAANNVRSITAALQNAQQEVAAAAIRAQIAQLQLAAHDQLLFAARQDVDALSSQMVGLQAAEGIVQPRLTVDMQALLEKLRQPLADVEKPTPVPPIVTLPPNLQKQPNSEVASD